MGTERLRAVFADRMIVILIAAWLLMVLSSVAFARVHDAVCFVLVGVVATWSLLLATVGL